MFLLLSPSLDVFLITLKMKDVCHRPLVQTNCSILYLYTKYFCILKMYVF